MLALLLTSLGREIGEVDGARMSGTGVGIAGLLLVFFAEVRRRRAEPEGLRPGVPRWVRRGPWVAVAVVLIAVGTAAVEDFSRKAREDLSDWTNDPLLATAARRPGLLLTAADQGLIQLRTRRPVVFDGSALDTLVFVPDAVPEAARILHRVYGIDLANLQEAHVSILPPDAARVLWEARTPGEWQAIAEEFGVTDVLTYPGWTLQLPRVASSAEFVLYGIPIAGKEAL